MTESVDAVRAAAPTQQGRGGSTAPGAREGWRRLLEPVGLPVLIYALARLVDAVFIIVASRHQPALGPTTVPGMFVFQSHPANPGYLGMITNWDGQWYQAIATQGYPLQVGDASQDELWRWAFPPGFPLLVGALMRFTGMSFAVAATVVNAMAGAGASVMLYALVHRVAGRFTAIRAVVVTSAFISAPILQMAYSEAMALFLVVGALLALQRRHYAWAVVAIGVLAFTRMVTAPLAIVVLVHFWSRARSEGWPSVRRREMAWGLTAAVAAVAGEFAWSLVGSALVGEPGLGRLANGDTQPHTWLLSIWTDVGWGFFALLVLLIAILALYAASSFSRAWGPELRAWSWAYLLFLVAVTGMHSGIWRYLVLSAPTLGLTILGSGVAARANRTRVIWLALVTVLFVLTQWWYIDTLVVIRGPGWSL